MLTPTSHTSKNNSLSAEAVRVTVMRAELAACIDRLADGEGAFTTAIPRLIVGKVSRILHPVHTVYEPALCVIAQGSKRVLLGDEVYVYDPSQYLVFAQNLPVAGQVVDASPESPHLAMRLNLDVKEITALALEFGFADRPAERRAERGIYTGELTTTLLEPLLRLLALLEIPEDVPALAPLVIREIVYRLLKSPDGWRLAQLAVVESHSQRVTQVIELLRKRYTETLRMEELARQVHWSVSALHHHFKAITAMSPLQYQKQLRLQEARRMMLGESIDAAAAGHRVGYDSQSQFTREYSRFFGAPPARDIKRLREQQARGMSG
ncbi:AraC family transcriptional regulator [Variovorax sp. YR266]|uniref:AraC family transcriptional regulator n=1 Tax=Variovorax sp. YR266 TaxID=1884386 RepID=UPI000B829189|nr:AraC family transcriptional regulator [Variovorax sp. YR266]